MPLEKTTIPVSLGMGIDTRTDPKQLQGKLTTLQNGIISGNRIVKRAGQVSLSQSVLGGGSISKGTGIEAFQSELTMTDGSSLYGYSGSNSKWVNRGSLVPVTFTTQAIVRNANQQTQPDSAYHAATGLQCFTYCDSSVGSPTASQTTPGVKYSIIDQATGTVVVNNATISASATKAKVLTLGSKFVIIYFDKTGNVLVYRTIDTASPTSLSSATTIASDIFVFVDGRSVIFDATIINNAVYVAYRKGSTQVAFYSLSSSLVLSSQYVVTTGDALNGGIALAGDSSNNVWLGYGVQGIAPNGPVRVLVVNSALNATLLAATTIDSVNTTNLTMIVSGTTATVIYDIVSGTSSMMIGQNTITLSGTVGTASTIVRQLGLASKVFAVSGVNYFLAAYQGQYVANTVGTRVPTSQEPTYFLINQSGVIVAKIAPGNGGGFYLNNILPEVTAISGSYHIAYLLCGDLSSVNGNVFYQTGVMNAKITFGDTPVKVNSGQNYLLSGGQTWMYDGAQVVEHGFHVYPENVSTTVTNYLPGPTSFPSGGVGTGLNTGTTDHKLQYCALYEWVDNQGQIHRSAPSPAVSVSLSRATPTSKTTSFSNGSATISIPDTSGILVGYYVSSASVSAGQWFNSQVTAVGSSSITLSSGFAGTTGSGVVQISPTPLTMIFGNVTLGSDIVTNVTVQTSTSGIYGNGTGTAGDTSKLFVGQALLDSGSATTTILPGGVTIAKILSSSSIQLSNPAQGTLTNCIMMSPDNAAVTVSVPTLCATAKNNVSIAIYRTTVNGTVFYRASSLTAPTYNDKTTDTINFTDTVPDGALIGNEQLYTNSGEVDNIGAPSFVALSTYKNRAIGIPAENGSSFWYSKQVIPGSPVEWSDLFVETVDATGGALTASAQMDDKLVLFKPNRILVTAGDGPSPAGTNNDFLEPQTIASDTGCSNPASIVLTPVGLMYQSPKGVYLIDRSLQNSYIGADVEAYNSQTITSAKLLPNTQQVRFTLLGGTCLVYDYYVQKWYVFTNYPAVDSTIYNGLFTYINSSGFVLQETPNSFTDNGAFIQLSLTTGWLNLAGIQALQRVWHVEVLGDYKSPHTLQVNVAYDYGTSFTQNVSIPVLSAPTTPYQFRIHVQNQKCEAIQIQIQDYQTSSFGEGMSLSGMTFYAGLKKGLEKLPASQSFG